MTSGAPWSVKGIDPKAREVAKDLARRSGMTLGEWLNRMILEDEGPEEITSESYFSERPKAYFEAARAPERPARYEAPEHPADEIGRVALALDKLSARIEQSEGRTGLAVAGVEQSVREAIARIEAAERDHVAVAARFEGAVEEARDEQQKLAERVRKIEKDAAGPRSTEALHALETALGKVAGHLYEGETRTREALETLENRVDNLAGRSGGSAPDPAAVIEAVVARVGERLTEAEGRTAEALQSLGEAFSALDTRLSAVEDGAGPAIEQRLEALAETLSARVEAARGEIAQKLQASADGRFDRMERTLGEMAEHVRQAEKTSAQAIERMGQEVLTIAETLTRRVQAGEQRSTQAIEQVGGEVARIAQTVESRLSRADSVHAEALERLGAEISRITERLAERVGAAERRSAQAIDDVGEQVARVTERIQARQDRVSEEIAERIRQSEERTARLLEEAREKIDRSLAESQRRAVAAAPAADPFAEDPFPAFGPAEPAADPLAAPPFAAPQAAFPQPERPAFEAEDFEAADDFVRIEEDAAPPAQAEAPEAGETADEPAADPFAPQALAAEFLRPSGDRMEAEDEEAGAEVEPVEPFPAAEPAASAEAPEALADLGRPLSTREVIEQARAAARSAATNGDSRKAGVKAKPKASKTSGFTLFSGLGAKPKAKRRAGSSLQTALLITGGAAFLSLGAAGFIIAEGEPGGEAPKRVADAIGLGRSGPIAAKETDGSPFGENPRVSVALAPQPLSTQGPAPAAAESAELSGMYEDAVRAIEAGEAGGVEDLRKAANLGHSPSQFFLSKLYENGSAGVPKDLAEARRWTERAAQNGNRHAMHNLAIAYVDGKGGPKNSTMAAQWFRRAADLGLVDSQYNLAALYEQGLGVSQNAAEAYKWYLIAAKSGDEEARASAARVRALLPPEARTVAERAAVAFRPAAPAPQPARTATAAMDPSVATAQRALFRLGYYKGPLDGVTSPALEGAVAQYQAREGLPATGSLDQATVARLSVFTR
ncbi:MAG: peptidoglycan-binding protein [Phenylobacterium sp.]|uniref:peptidoglycan-binding protein n=1 Tax=Phenylobacterium sp. TaxID=1871053 RepID=UPI003919B546